MPDYKRKKISNASRCYLLLICFFLAALPAFNVTPFSIGYVLIIYNLMWLMAIVVFFWLDKKPPAPKSKPDV